MRASDRIGTAVVLLSLIATATWSADSRQVRHPADWTDRERFAALTNDDEATRRIEAHRTAKPRIDSNAEAPRPYDIIDGAQNPHLYFPVELFDHVARYAFVDDPKFRAAYREMREESRRKLGLPDDFWLQLESITAAYRADQQEERALAVADVPSDERASRQRSIQTRACNDRKRALAAANATFGPAFERFLYETVARSMTTTVLRKPDEKFRAYVMGECQ